MRYMNQETMEQRGQSQACLIFAESRQRKAKGQYARVSVEMPENDTKKTLRHDMTYEIENPDIQDKYTVKF